MLGKPAIGWVRIELEDFKFSASYLTDIPCDWLEAIEFGLRTGNPICLKADGEDAGDIYIILDGSWVCMTDGYQYTRFFLNSYADDITKEIIKDIRYHIDDWAYWWLYEDDTEKEVKERKEYLTKLITKAEEAWEERYGA